MTSGLPWVTRFDLSISDDELRARAERYPNPPDLNVLSRIAGAEALREAFRQLFLLDDQRIALIRKYISVAATHSEKTYTSAIDYSARVYVTPEPSTEIVAALLTGLAGTGKTELMKAVERVFPPQSSVSLPSLEIPLVSFAKALIGHHKSALKILRSVRSESGPIQIEGKNVSDCLESLSQRIYQLGIPLLLADELQFLAKSKHAVTMIVDVLFKLGCHRCPLTYVANFSLVHKLIERNQEDTDRLLANVDVLLPHLANSSGWRNLLEAIVAIAPKAFLINIDSDSAEIHSMTFGLPRGVCALFAVAYEQSANGEVTLDDLRKAYRSARYTAKRRDVEKLKQIALGAIPSESDQTRSDLICPFDGIDLAQFVDSAAEEALKLSHKSAKRLDESLTTGEAEAKRVLEKEQRPKRKNQKGGARTESDLLAGLHLANGTG